MVKHVVMFKLKGDSELRRRVASEFAEALLALPDKIECLQDMEAHLNENPAEDWDVMLIATVGSMQEVDVYAKHPAHVAAAAIVAPHKESRACVDYQI